MIAWWYLKPFTHGTDSRGGFTYEFFSLGLAVKDQEGHAILVSANTALSSAAYLSPAFSSRWVRG